MIVLDSCEHVVGAAASIAEAVVKAAPHVRILATSREPLRAEGEWLHRLASLELPPLATSPTADEAMRYSAIELFYDRAIATVDGFVLDDGDVRAVLEICRRLDGMPLALELAAAHENGVLLHCHTTTILIPDNLPPKHRILIGHLAPLRKIQHVIEKRPIKKFIPITLRQGGQRWHFAD